MEIDFKELMSNKSVEGLQEYLDNRSKFIPEAVEAAIVEFQSRGRTFSEEELNTIKHELEQRKIEIMQKYERRANTNPHYWWGLLGLIPLIGAIVGFILILLGIFRFKDRIMVYIGTACILFTVGIYSYLFYQIKNSDKFVTGFATIAQIDINGLVKEIEFYKIQNGSYPNKIEDLQENDNSVSIVDPILLNHSIEGNLNYHYEKVDDRYRIYSVGIDRIGNTADDIYPTISSIDSTKIGFIKRNE